MKKVSLFLIISFLIIACGAPSTNTNVDTIDSITVDSAGIDTIYVDSTCNC